jgi:DNA ligase (NAD+)
MVKVFQKEWEAKKSLMDRVAAMITIIPSMIEEETKSDLTNSTLENLSFCFTGKLETMKRSQAQTIVVDNGGTIGSVSKKLTYLVTNTPNSGSGKNKKASALGIKLITENEFLAMLP